MPLNYKTEKKTSAIDRPWWLKLLKGPVLGHASSIW